MALIMSGQRVILMSLLMVAALSANSQAREGLEVCSGITLAQLEDKSNGEITMAWRLDSGVSNEVYGFRMIFEKDSVVGFKISTIWGAEVLSISEAQDVPADTNQIQFLVRLKTNPEWIVDLFGFHAFVKTAYVKYDLLECNGQSGVFAKPPFVPYSSNPVPPSCSWMTQSQFIDWTKFGGITLEYKTDPGMANAQYTFRVVVQNGEAPSVSIGNTWNADVDYVSEPEPIEDIPDQIAFTFVLKTHSRWDVNEFGFNIEMSTSYVSHEVIDCPKLPPPDRSEPSPSRGVSRPSRGVSRAS